MAERSPSALLNRASRLRSQPVLAARLRDGYLLARRLLARLGFQLVISNYDSPIPNVQELDASTFERASLMRGITFDIEAQFGFVERELAEFTRDFQPPLTAAQAGSHCFYLLNGTYESGDAELLYGMLRHLRPSRVLELGSGFSTLIAREALAANGTGELLTYDPYRSPLLPPDAPVVSDDVQTMPESVFTALTERDVLFVDTSHTVKQGGDVNRIVLDLLPLLAPGVVVHFHDIFLPYPYTRQHLLDAHFWAEQYLLQAFLSGNRDWEVLVGAHALARTDARRLSASIPSLGPHTRPGAFWIRRTA